MLRHFPRKVFFLFFFLIFNLGNIFWKFWPKSSKKCQKSDFLAKTHVFDFFGQNFQKYCLIQKFEKQNKTKQNKKQQQQPKKKKNPKNKKQKLS